MSPFVYESTIVGIFSSSYAGTDVSYKRYRHANVFCFGVATIFRWIRCLLVPSARLSVARYVERDELYGCLYFIGATPKRTDNIFHRPTKRLHLPSIGFLPYYLIFFIFFHSRIFNSSFGIFWLSLLATGIPISPLTAQRSGVSRIYIGFG